MSRLIWLVILAACSGKPAVRPAPPEMANLDVYGSAVLDREHLIARYRDPLVLAIREPDLLRALAERIAKDGDFAYAEFSQITYYDPERTFTTLDLVDRRDAARRMTYVSVPSSREHADPDGLIAAWNDDYEPKFMAHLKDNTLDFKAPCPFWHCLGFGNAELEPFRDRFAASVPAHEAELAAILLEDSRMTWRATAAFLLAHLASGPRVVELMLQRIRDPEALVRNNTMRVLALIAIDHPEVDIPVGPILDVLELPSTLDRNKASAVLSGLVKREANRATIRARGGATLVAMLALGQPNNHDFAYKILKTLAGKDLGEHDLAAWRAWLASDMPR